MMKRRIISILLSCCMMLPTAAFAESNNAAVQEQFDLTVGETYYFYLTPNAENPDIPENSLHYVPFVYAGTVNAYTLTAANAETATVEEADASKYVHSLFIADNILQFGSIGDFFDLREHGMIYGREYKFGGVTYDLRAPSTGRKEIFNEENKRYEVLPHSNEWDAICDKNQELIHNYSDQFKDSWSYGQDMIRTANGEQSLSRGYMGIRESSYYPGDYYSTKGKWRYGYRPVLEIKDAGAVGQDALRVLEVDLNGGLVDGKSTIRLVAGKGASVTAPPIDGIRTPTGYVTEGFVWRGDNGQSYAPGAQIPAEVSSLTAVWKRETTGLMVGETYYFDLSGINYTQGDTLTPAYELFTEQIPSGTLNYVPFTFVGEVDAYVLNEKAYTQPDVDDQAAQTRDANAEYGYTYPHSLFLADCALLKPSNYGVFFNQENFDTWKTLLYGQAYASGGVTYKMRAPSVGSPANNEWVQIMHKDDRLIVGKDADKAYIGQECNLIGDYKTVYRNSRFWSENQWKLHTLGYLLEGLTEYWRPVLELPQDVRAEDYREVTLDLNGGKLGSDAGPVKLAVKNGSEFTAPKRDGLTPPEGSAGTYLRWVSEDGHYYMPGKPVPGTVRKLTADWATEERFELEPGKTYYFDLSGEGIPGTVNEKLPDTTLHYVPFTYSGNIAAYWDTSGYYQHDKIITAEDAIQNQHSLFVADHNVTNSVSWNALNEKYLIFGLGRFYDGHSYESEHSKLYYTMRAPTGGNTAQAQYPYECESPRCNEWDVLIDKDPNNIKNWQDAFSYAQEIYNAKDSQGNQVLCFRTARGKDSQRRLFLCSPDESLYSIGYRPVLEANVFEADAMQTVTLDLNGGKLGNSGDDIAIVVSKEEAFRAPASAGLTRPAGDESGTYFFWVDDNGQRYRPGEAVPVGTKKLTAQWRVRELFDLEVGGTYYFDLSGAGIRGIGIPGTVNEDLPDTTLHYVPFTQVGTVEAYYDNRYLYDKRTEAHSLLIADYNITNYVSWNTLSDAGLLFSSETKFGGVYYALRAPSIGYVFSDVITPENNEWDMILKKGDYIKNLEKYKSLGQFDGYSRGLLKRYDPGNGTLKEIQTWFQCGSYPEPNLGYRPVLQILNTDSPSNDTGTVTLRLNGGTLGTSDETELKIVTAKGVSFTAPAREGLTPPAGKENGAFVWLGDDGSYYRPGMTVPAEVSVLTAQWDTATYTVTLPSGTGYAAAAADGSTSPVSSGESFSFTVTISSGFRKGTNFAVKVNGNPLTETDGKYAISNITENQVVTVEGVEEIPPTPGTYTVTLPSGTGYTAAAADGSTSPVASGGSFNFTVTISSGFQKGESFAVKANGNPLTETDGKYAISNITESQIVTVEGVEEIPPIPGTYTVTLPSGTGYAAAAADGSTSPVASGGSFSFTVTISSGFQKGESFAAKANGNPLTETDGKYTISNITEDQIVTVEGVEKIPPIPGTYTVIFDANGGSVSPASMTTGADGKLASLPTPTRSSYSFDGWYTEKSGGTKVTIETIFKKETTVYAHWTYTGGSGGDSGYTYYTLTFETNGGSTIFGERFRSGTAVDLTKYTPTYKGYTFTGWYSDSGLNSKITSIRMDGNKTVYAGWKKQAAGNPFTDISKSDWFYDDVMFVYEKSLMVGTSDTTFSPYGTATRAMMATILWRMEGSPAPKNAPDFTDVASGKWYSDAIAWTTGNGIYQGYGNGKFGPDDPITREQLAAIFYRYADYKGYDMTVKGSLDKFKDKDKISALAQDAMQWAVCSGLIQGKTGSVLDPQGTATRAEIAAMLHRFIEKYGLVEGKAPGGMMGWIDPKRLKIPQTGDASALGLWGFILCASLAGCLALTTAQLRRKREEEALQITQK